MLRDKNELDSLTLKFFGTPQDGVDEHGQKMNGYPSVSLDLWMEHCINTV
jgi:hypothetical protein